MPERGPQTGDQPQHHRHSRRRGEGIVLILPQAGIRHVPINDDPGRRQGGNAGEVRPRLGPRDNSRLMATSSSTDSASGSLRSLAWLNAAPCRFRPPILERTAWYSSSLGTLSVGRGDSGASAVENAALATPTSGADVTRALAELVIEPSGWTSRCSENEPIEAAKGDPSAAEAVVVTATVDVGLTRLAALPAPRLVSKLGAPFEPLLVAVRS